MISSTRPHEAGQGRRNRQKKLGTPVTDYMWLFCFWDVSLQLLRIVTRVLRSLLASGLGSGRKDSIKASEQKKQS